MRTHFCGELGLDDAGNEVELYGWVHRRRDHGGVVFIDLRDRSGLVQLVFHPEKQPDAYRVAEGVRSEYVLRVAGTVAQRLEGAVNPDISTGEVEVLPSSIEVLSEAKTPPFLIEDGIDTGEEVRLKYRYVDLRRPEMQEIVRLRHRAIRAIRKVFDDEGFVEVETPMLNKSTPEGARDYLVPSRLQPGTFFALQQSPQLFKQLLMIAGMDRYYQIVRCFRDEDPRADRQPDFTQLDMEISFVDEAEIREMAEKFMAAAFEAAIGIELPRPFPQMAYAEAMRRFGTDKPDLRFGMELTDVSEVFAGTELRVFRQTLESGGIAVAIRIPNAEQIDRKALDDLTQAARSLGAGGLAWIRFEEDKISSPLAKVLSDTEVKDLRATLATETGDLALIVCDDPKVAPPVLGEIRLAVAERLGLRPGGSAADADSWKFVWIVDPPLVAWNETQSRWDPVHHPFTAPQPGDEALLETDPGAVRARAYDVVLNGWEVAGGSIRIHRPDLQRKVFELIGIDEASAESRFGWFVRAFDYGAPPHGGIAAGLDRLVALLAGRDNIREAIAFPKTTSMTDIMTGAPDTVDPDQLAELRIRTVQTEA